MTIDVEFVLTVGVDYSPPDPGRVYGPIETCYPPEPEMIDLEYALVTIRKGRSDELVTEVDFTEKQWKEVERAISAKIAEDKESVELDRGDYLYESMIDKDLMGGR